MASRHWVRHYRMVSAFAECGSNDHPCSVEHIVVPIE